MITGGKIVNGRRSAPESEVTKTLNGPSCSGTIVGGTTHNIKVGDIIIIPEGVPHGFTAIADHVTYLSIRPDLKKVLQHGYVNPGSRNKGEILGWRSVSRSAGCLLRFDLSHSLPRAGRLLLGASAAEDVRHRVIALVTRELVDLSLGLLDGNGGVQGAVHVVGSLTVNW